MRAYKSAGGPPPFACPKGSPNHLKMMRKRSLPWKTGGTKGHENEHVKWRCQVGDELSVLFSCFTSQILIFGCPKPSPT